MIEFIVPALVAKRRQRVYLGILGRERSEESFLSNLVLGRGVQEAVQEPCDEEMKVAFSGSQKIG